MPTRKRAGLRPRTTVGARRRRGAPTRPSGLNRELSEILDAQVQSGHELRKTKVPVATEPAFVFKP
jgi:hypothetical protein